MTIEEEIDHAEAERIAALLDKNGAALAARLADDAIIVHSNGLTETKAENVAKVAAGTYDYKTWNIVRRQMAKMGEVVIVNGDTAASILRDGVVRQATLRYIQAWVNQGGVWRLWRWQSVVLPAPEGT